MFGIVNHDLARQAIAPSPQHEIDSAQRNIRHKTGYNHAIQSLIDKPLRDFLRWRRPAAALERQPSAGHIQFANAHRLARVCARQIGNAGAVNVIFAQGQWQHAVCKALRAFGERGYRLQRKI